VGRTALIAGASGLVGSHCLRLLLDEPAYERVIALARRALPLEHPKLEQRVVDFDRLANLPDPARADDAYCCLGSTIRRAGSQQAFRRVDLTYVVDFARLATRGGGARFLLISALGADPRSRVFYSRVKGEAEAAVRQVMGAGTYIFRPSLLTGARTEVRLGERIGIPLARAVSFVLVGPLRPYRPIAAETVARAMVRVALEGGPGPRVYRSDQIVRLAR
jgi:uncharacterized protein YbjT (DUF2867 family)